MLENAAVVIPERLSRLPELASDLWWTWNNQAREVFRRLDYPLWRQTAHNPVLMLRQISQDILDARAADQQFLSVYDEAMEALAAACGARDTWWHHRYPDASGPLAYFSAEFALHQSLPIYAGGLGVLAGDHCKEASDLGIPLIGVGFMYPQGYFHQSVSPEGWQQESYEHLNWSDAPIEPALTPEGQPCIVAVPLGNRTVLVSVWRVRLGRVKLYLLDTDLEENTPWDRELSARLYGGDRETRIQQEIILGIGGVRALKAMGSVPSVWHLNEGHAAFVVLQRIRELIEQGDTFESALDEVRRTTIFTTHTPVPAGHDAFPFSLVETHLAGAWGTLGPYRDAFMALGHYDNGSGPLFNMTALALRTAGAVNAVSQLHGQVTRDMWGPIWPGVSDDKRPVRAITNGVHAPTWLSSELSRLFDEHLDAGWRDRHDDPEVWARILEIPDEDLWAARQSLRQYLFAFIRERARRRWREEHVSAARVVAAGTLLDPNALTIGFARRFTGYKRPELIFRNPDRLLAILNAARGPLQIVFAGKAHPADETGKHHLQQVYRRATDPMFGGRIAFVDDYDLHVAHFLVQGCDVWMNNPRKPLEASGTSGMKASLNGVPHLSIGDGWWAEGYTGDNGWLIDAPETGDQDTQDAADVEALYDLLEHEIVPTFYDRNPQGVPTRWLSFVRRAICSVAPRFSARRMVKEYAESLYGPAMRPRQQEVR
ncbi:MAG: alpha-glucan family phosphorylase [Acidobacteria bacterium]|nr:alpha-glucan family phosphorylase [Acidobacteriota bacterium]MBA3885397.1 alpha-glucan family phosphorylase [Acidobacteriota bacterium]